MDTLLVVRSPIEKTYHTKAIPDSLIEDYDAFVTSIVSRSNLSIVSKIEALLMAKEKRIESYIESK